MQRTLLVILALGTLSLAGCSSVGSGGAPPAVAASAEPAAPPIPTGAALGGALGGPVGASLSDGDRQTARRTDRRHEVAAHVVQLGHVELPRLFPDHLYRRPAESRPRRRLQAAGRKLENDELRF